MDWPKHTELARPAGGPAPRFTTARLAALASGEAPANALAGDSAPGRARAGAPPTSLPRTGTGVTAAMLGAFPIFAKLSAEDLARLAADCILRSVPRNTQLIRAGEPTRFVHLILSGALSIVLSNEEGREAILLELGPGKLFGEMGAIDGQPGSETVLAIHPCLLILLPRAAFRRCLQVHPSVAEFVLRSLAAQQEEAYRRITSLCLDDVPTRVIQLLRQRELGVGPSIEGKLNRQRIAKMVGASREMVSRVLTDLKARGWVTTRNGHVLVITDPQRHECGIDGND